MASVYARGGKLWCRLKDERGQWVSRPTPYGTDEPGQAQRYADAAQKTLDDRRAGADVAGGAVAAMPTVAAYLARWSAERAAIGIGSAQADRKRIERHAMPHLGMLRMDEVRPRHVRDLVRALKAAGELAPRSILQVFRALHTMFENALVDELVTVNPVVVKAGELPKKRDKEPEWRSQATYTVREVGDPGGAPGPVRAQGAGGPAPRRGGRAVLAPLRRDGRAAGAADDRGRVLLAHAADQGDEDGGDARGAGAPGAGEGAGRVEAVALGTRVWALAGPR